MEMSVTFWRRFTIVATAAFWALVIWGIVSLCAHGATKSLDGCTSTGNAMHEEIWSKVGEQIARIEGNSVDATVTLYGFGRKRTFIDSKAARAFVAEQRGNACR